MSRFVAGTDVFSRQSDGTSVAKQYGKYGIHLRPANTDRVSGWAEILHLLGDPQSLQENAMPLNPQSKPVSQLSTLNSQLFCGPRLFIHQRCQRLLTTLPDLQHDPHRPEDVLKVDADESGAGGDDAADCLRYLVASLPRRAGFACL